MEDINKKIIQINAYNELMEPKEYIVSIYDIISCKKVGLTLFLNCVCNSISIYFKNEPELKQAINELKNNYISLE